MEELKNKLIEFLETKSEPYALSLICAEFPSYPRRQVAFALEDLGREDKVYRSVIIGKAFYSVNPEEGESKVPALIPREDEYEGGFSLRSLISSITGEEEEEEEEVELRDISAIEGVSGEEVLIDRSMVLIVPEGMIWSNKRGVISDKRAFTALLTDDNYGTEYSFNDPFPAPVSITITNKMNNGLDISNADNRAAVLERLKRFPLFTKNIQVITESEKLMVIFGGFRGNTSAMIIVAPDGVYSGQFFINDSTILDKDEMAIAFLKGIRECREGDYELVPAPDFIAPTYNDGEYLTVGFNKFAVPDGTLIITDDEYKYIVSDDYNNGEKKTEDCRIQIRVSKVISHEDLNNKIAEGTLEDAIRDSMQKISAIDNPWIKLKKVHERCWIGCVHSTSSENEVEYWENFGGIIVNGTTMNNFDLVFNSKKDTDAVIKAVEEWLVKIVPGTPEDETAYYEKLREEELKGFKGSDGRISGITVSQLFSNDCFFFDKEDIQVKDGRRKAVKCQFNSEKMDSTSVIVRNASEFSETVVEIANFLEDNDYLKIPEEYYNKRLSSINFSNPMTGSSLLNLCANHIITVHENNANTYVAMIDSDVMKCIPEGFKYFCEFIKTLREFNGTDDDFSVIFDSAFNFARPLQSSARPVHGAVPMDNVTINVAKGEHPYKDVIKVLEKVSPEEAMTKERLKLQSGLEPLIIDTVREGAEFFYEAINGFADDLEEMDFRASHIYSFESAVNKVERMIQDYEKYPDIHYNSWSNPHNISYRCTNIYAEDHYISPEYNIDIITDGLEESSDINDFPRRIVEEIRNINEEDVYLNLLYNLKSNLESSGVEKPLSKFSVAYVKQAVLNYAEDGLQLDATNRAGRNARIESLSVGDKLSADIFVDSDGQPYVDVRSNKGSVGLLSTYIGKVILPLLKRDLADISFKAVEVTPLSQRGHNAKYSIVRVLPEMEEKVPIDPEVLAARKAEARRKAEEEARRKAEEERIRKEKEEAERIEKERIAKINGIKRELQDSSNAIKEADRYIEEANNKLSSAEAMLASYTSEESEKALEEAAAVYTEKLTAINAILEEAEKLSKEAVRLVNSKKGIAYSLSGKEASAGKAESDMLICDAKIEECTDGIKVLMQKKKVLEAEMEACAGLSIEAIANVEASKFKLKEEIEFWKSAVESYAEIKANAEKVFEKAQADLAKAVM